MNFAVRPPILPYFDRIRVGTHSDGYSDHVKAHRLHMLAREETLSALEFGKICAKYEGVRWEEITATDINRVYTRARYMIINRVAEAFPHMSSTRLGKIFKRNHVTILFNLGRIPSRTPRFFKYVKKEVK